MRFMMRQGQRFNCYAPGDGALAFVWVQENKNRQWICTSRKVTLVHIRDFLKHSDGKHLAEKGWKVFSDYGQLRLVAPVRRINANTLELQDNGKTFPVEYTIDPTYVHDGHISFYAIKATFEHKGLGRTELKNWSMLHQIMFFLNHEKELTPTTVM